MGDRKPSSIQAAGRSLVQTARGWASSVIRLGRPIITDLNRRPIRHHAAALAYYTAFSLAPTLILLVRALSWWLGRRNAEQQVMGQLEHYAGRPATHMLDVILRNVAQSSGWVPALVASAILLIAASRVFTVLHDDLNRTWEVPPPEGPERKIEAGFRKRLVSFLMILGAGAVVVISMLASAVVGSLERWFAGLVPSADTFQLVNGLISFALLALALAAVYKFVPDAPVPWRAAWVGAITTSALFAGGRILLSLYFDWSGLGSAYLAAGSVLVILLWLYYSSLVVLLGARTARLYDRRWGSAQRSPGRRTRHSGRTGARDSKTAPARIEGGQLHGAF